VKTRRILPVAVLLTALALSSACGRESTKQAVKTTAAASASGDFTGNPDSAYCRAALDWSIVELSARDGSPAGETKYWNDYASFLAHGVEVAPAEVKAPLQALRSNVANNMMPIFRKYEFDEERFMKSATEAEKKAVMENPPAVEKAFEKVLAYEWQVCGNGTPDAATDVKFTGDKNGPYCKVESAAVKAFQDIGEAGLDPEAVKVFSIKTLPDAVAKLTKLAPPEIKSDVEANAEWIRTRQNPVFAKYGYDIRKMKANASAEERFAYEGSDVEIRDVMRRLNAYDAQVCGL
jgi:hypothetical protein